MLQWMETFVDDHSSTKEARFYSLLPVATSFQAASVKIDVSTLFGIFARLHCVESWSGRVDEYLSVELNIDLSRTRVSASTRLFTMKSFRTHRSEIMRMVLSVAQIETKTRKFANEVKINGFAVSMTTVRPLVTIFVVAVENPPPRKKEERWGSSCEDADESTSQNTYRASEV